ncbi:DNA polymerase III subunit beta [Buchnera aphidicola]|uniref:DNA polymerase III subunit beta n=1 Tax=Buchnera aphidicola TaxID=9 RepID=UPI000189C694|nr:DNA polymerase III subunit beta [Buchnera aphidicola]ACL29845.1 DNA polymerase III beta chain [Buchnera aphidicola str. Tuc7 (Acyrthosiphon pisum)]ADP65843.1 DNA polymerase III beta chain [Buchnera aphidicola str. LL01 (Acyrthosiphon pisum)]ADP66419.1 DNA polymerase III beta chain [Buchnera aphidicola str. TLW03 (Acyrthosiphon pisum)]ADP66993.1 DNA polymerase III beta chain [Buchnera aphidicola str. JF99 (Acyrthosiphon pisum)]
MKFIINNNILIKNLQKISRLLVKNTSLPILDNVLINIKNGMLSLTGTNLEIELVAMIQLSTEHISGTATISGRKLLDICRNSLNSSNIEMQLNNNKMHIISGNSRYILTTLPYDSFPVHHDFHHISEFFIPSDILKKMIEKIQFSMGKQDVRYYLNGILLEKTDRSLYAVATDGYRLGISKFFLKENIIPFSIVIPRKGVIELYRLLNIPKQPIKVLVGKNNIRVHIEDLIFTTQLIEGQYPDYKSVLLENKNNFITLNSKLLKQSLLRAAILSHEKFCGVEIHIRNGQFKVLSDNQEEEIAEDRFNINYTGNTVKISINVYYIIEILNSITSENIFLFLNNANNSIQIEAENDASILYVVMLLKR